MKSIASPLSAAVLILGLALSAFAAEPPLPWQREVPLREAARSVFLTNTLNATNPLPDWSCYPVSSRP